jgi:hypothetical protein
MRIQSDGWELRSHLGGVGADFRFWIRDGEAKTRADPEIGLSSLPSNRELARLLWITSCGAKASSQCLLEPNNKASE